MDEYDYEDAPEDKPSDNLLARLSAQGSQVEATAKEAKQCLARLAQLKQIHQHLTETVIPELMKEAGMKSFTTVSGIRIEVKEVITASFPSASTASKSEDELKRRVRIIRWLDSRGYGHLVQRQLNVTLEKDQAELAQQISEDLRRKGVAVEKKFAIHFATFNKFARECLEQGIELPEDFRVFNKPIAQLPAAYKVSWAALQGNSSED